MSGHHPQFPSDGFAGDFTTLATSTKQVPPPDATPSALLDGKWIFAGVFALLIVWLWLIPARRIGHADGVPAWWRNVRFWAIAIAATQMLVYVIWG
jgi:hypothetical protein